MAAEEEHASELAHELRAWQEEKTSELASLKAALKACNFAGMASI